MVTRYIILVLSRLATRVNNMSALQEEFVSLKKELISTKELKEQLLPRYKELSALDNNGYSIALNDLVNNRTKAEEREFNNLSNQISGLNSKITGLQKKIIKVGSEILEEIAKKAEQI